MSTQQINHCRECGIEIGPGFKSCWDHCSPKAPYNSQEKNAVSTFLGSIGHSLVSTPGVFDGGVCGHCGFPRENLPKKA